MKRPATALTHDWIWGAIDALARERALTPSALARLAGLDPTTFNPSKRFTPEGRPRWPSTESLSKLLAATSLSLDEFAALEIVRPQRATQPAAAAQPLDSQTNTGNSSVFRIGRAS
jgi:phage repressor protein C with HTH and peptisase S24 domain